MKRSNPKSLYLTLALVAAASYFCLPRSNWPVCSFMVAACLLGAFWGREKVEDERVEHLKLKAIKLAFGAAYILVFLYTWAMSAIHGTAWHRHFPSAFDMIILMMAIALGLYHYWRWQDGREAKP